MTVSKVNECRVYFERRGRLRSHGLLYIAWGRKTLLVGEMSQQNYDYARDYQRRTPWLICTYDGWQYWMFENVFFRDDERRNTEQMAAYFAMKRDREGRQHQLQLESSRLPVAPGGRARGYIPDEVKVFVHKRDGGRCVHCGATDELQYDHVIPIAKGGASTAQNLQLLCAPCNRRKGPRLTVDPYPY